MAVPPSCRIFASIPQDKDNQRGHEINTKIKYSANWGYMAGYPCVYKKRFNVYSTSQKEVVLSSGSFRSLWSGPHIYLYLFAGVAALVLCPDKALLIL